MVRGVKKNLNKHVKASKRGTGALHLIYRVTRVNKKTSVVEKVEPELAQDQNTSNKSRVLVEQADKSL